ncbi:MAG: two component transcriptional regulator winged helix [Planctomycetota bacterium]|nr:MAG: two component transcriptional regulator winged helix [Planctomycetota bacterium]
MSDVPQNAPPEHLVCYVDDEVNLLGVVKRGLERRGWKVEAIGDPFDALRKIRKAMPRVVVLDLLMPGMDGFQVLRAVKSSQDLASIPVIIGSARDSQKDKEMAFSLGAAAFLVKPFGIKELVLTIESVLGQSMIPPPERTDSSDVFGRPGGAG